MTYDEQTSEWVAGRPRHSETNECTPDFSCCQPSLLAPEEERRAFEAADENGRYMLWYWNESSARWEFSDEGEIDGTHVTFEIDHFSKYAVGD